MNAKHRSFLQLATKATIISLFAGLTALALSSCARSPAQPQLAETTTTKASWKTTIVSETEPGEPLIVSGTIFAPDGRTPLEGISLYVYQTDATGRYSTTGGDNRNTRIHGLLRTNSEGRYEFRTIKPAPYPENRIPAHIHAYVSGPGYPEYWIDEYHFDDDPFLTSEMRGKVAGKGSQSSILTLTRGADGILRGVRDITIERCAKNCTGQ